MLSWKVSVSAAVLLAVACSSEETSPAATNDASTGGTAISGTGGGGSSGRGATPGAGGRTTGGNAGTGGAPGTGGAKGGAGGATDASTDSPVSDGSAPDGPVPDGNADATEASPVDAGCRGAAAAVCPNGSWHRYETDGGATCATCPGPRLDCTTFDLGASTFTAGSPKRIIKVALAPGAAEILVDDDLRIRATFQGSSCGGNPGVTTFGKAQTTVEHDASGRTFFSVDIGLINSTMVPCGDVHFTVNDGCCTHQEVSVSAVYDDGSGTTTFSCVDGG